MPTPMAWNICLKTLFPLYFFIYFFSPKKPHSCSLSFFVCFHRESVNKNRWHWQPVFRSLFFHPLFSTAMGATKKWLSWSQMVASMLLVQLFATGQQLLSKGILNQGTFIFSFMAYRHLVAALCVAPFAFFLERFPLFHACYFMFHVIVSLHIVLR